MDEIRKMDESDLFPIFKKDYESGLSAKDIAKKHGFNYMFVRKLFNRYDFKFRPVGQARRIQFGKIGLIDDKAIIDLYVNKGLSAVKVSQMINTSVSTVCKRLRKNGVRVRGLSAKRIPKRRTVLPWKDLIEGYLSGLSCGGVGKKFGIDPHVVWHGLRRRGVILRTKEEALLLAGVRSGGVSTNYYRKRAFESYGSSCEVCGYNKCRILEVHHLDEDRFNNDVSNLCVICPNCHEEETKGFITLVRDLNGKLTKKENENVS